MIPSMGGREIGEDLKIWSELAEVDTVIVELGVWLGAGTEFIAKGVKKSGKDIKIHCFDRFVANESEVEKASEEIKLKKGQDTLPIVKKYLSEYNNIVYHKGNILKAKWNGNPISLYVDDVCKREKKFNYAIQTFSPFWIPGKTIIVFMDYFWHLRHPNEPDAQCQPNFIKSNAGCFHHLKDWKDFCCSSFLYLGGFNI